MQRYADYIFINGNIFTAGGNNDFVEAVAVAGNKIAAAGSKEEVEAWRNSKTHVFDLKGRTLLPGLIDAHTHLGIYGVNKSSIPCGSSDVSSINEIINSFKERAAKTPPGSWIRGWGYDQNKLAEERHPTCWDLDKAAPEHPVFLSRVCAHVAVVNTKALEILGITDDTPDPPDGKLGRENGRVNGVLFEGARRIAWEKAAPAKDELADALKLAYDDMVSFGLTSAHDMVGYGPAQLRAMHKLSLELEAPLRVYQAAGAMFDVDNFQEATINAGLATNFGNERLRIGPYKRAIDGASSAPTMATREPYTSDPGNSGILYFGQEKINELFEWACRAGFQLTAHSMGDRANEMTINGIEHAINSCEPRGRLMRHRIEHCALIDEEMVKRIASLRIIPVSQPCFINSSGDIWVKHYGEERASKMFPLASYVKAGIPVPLSSDAPIATPDPMLGIAQAILRRAPSGFILGPEECITLEQAIKGYTIYAAYAEFAEDIKGSIENGKLADLVVLSGNIFETAPEDIPQLTVDLTMLDGKVVYCPGS